MSVRHRDVTELGQTTEGFTELPAYMREGWASLLPFKEASICEVTLKVVFYAQHLSVPTLRWAQSPGC